MAVGKSKRIVIEVDDVDLKRRLYSALAQDGRSLKDWFMSSAADFLVARIHGRQLDLPTLSVAESIPSYAPSPNAKSSGS